LFRPTMAHTNDRELSSSHSATHCGYVALIGAPNAGKSTLLNRLVGETLSIVTPKAQTTWRRITGIRTTDRHQSIFLDTPGVLTPRDLLHRSFLQSAREAAAEADLLLLVTDPTLPLSHHERDRLVEVAEEGRAPRIGVVNKVDIARRDAVETEQAWLESAVDGEVHLVSAATGDGIDSLSQAIETALPAGPFLYPSDEIATEPVRFFVAEMVRQVIFEEFREEIPYSTFCEVEEFREGGKRTYVNVVIYVERRSQKGILVGDGGRAIRNLGTLARKRIETFLEEPVYLDLWVKVLPGWRRKSKELRRLGFPIPRDAEVRPGS
jgi:GTPase